MNPTTPHAQPLPGITCAWFSLLRFRSPLLTESLLFSLPMGTEMFHFPTFPPHSLYIQLVVTRHHSCWVSPFGHPRITARLTTPRGLSRPTTSFIGSWYQGIHRTPLHTYNNTYKQPPHTEPQRALHTRIECRHHQKLTNFLLNHTPTTPATPTRGLPALPARNKDARIHYALLKQHTPHPAACLRAPPQDTSPTHTRSAAQRKTCVPSEPR